MFDDFWKMYPRKVAKKHALKIWSRLKKNDHELILLALPTHIQQWEGKEIEYVPHPGSWLNDERWTDEIQVKQDWKLKFIRGEK